MSNVKNLIHLILNSNFKTNNISKSENLNEKSVDELKIEKATENIKNICELIKK